MIHAMFVKIPTETNNTQLFSISASAFRHCQVHRWHLCREKHWHTHQGIRWKRQPASVQRNGVCGGQWAQSCRSVCLLLCSATNVYFLSFCSSSSEVSLKSLDRFYIPTCLQIQTIKMCRNTDDECDRIWSQSENKQLNKYIDKLAGNTFFFISKAYKKNLYSGTSENGCSH